MNRHVVLLYHLAFSTAFYLAVGVVDGPGPRRNLRAYVPPDFSGLLSYHNEKRALHKAPPLVWSNTLANDARSWAASCNKQHKGPGENFCMSYGRAKSTVPRFCAGLWYDNEVGYYKNLYGVATPTSQQKSQTGHFTQMVWIQTREIGCGMATCNWDGKSWDFVVCRYSPAGNMAGAYGQNVKAA